MTEIERLLAKDAIKQLRSRYLRLLDTKQWDEMVSLYTSDATLRFESEAPGMVFRGREGIREMVATSLVDVITVHHAHMAEIEFQSPDNATGIWALEDLLRFGPNSRSPGKRIHSFGHLNDSYVRTDGRWLIRDVAITRSLIDQA